MNKTRDGTRAIKLPRGIRKHHTGKYIVDVCVNKVRKTRIFATVEDAIIGRQVLKNKLLLQHKRSNMSALISFSQSAGAIETVKDIENKQAQQDIGYIDIEPIPAKPAPTADFIFPVTGQTVRTVQYEGKIWFVARDVAAVLGFVLPQKAIIDHCKYAKVLKGSKAEPLTTSPRGINIIPESDVYRLVMRSKLPTAEAFQDWVVEVVLPALRRDGGYMLPPSPEESPEDILARAVIIAQKTIERQTAELTEARPVVRMYDHLTKGRTCWPFRIAMQELRVSLSEIHKVCLKSRLFRKEMVANSKRLWPTGRAKEQGLVEVYKQKSGNLTYGFTPYGMQWLKDKLYLA